MSWTAGPLQQRKEAELDAEYLERVQGEDERHARWMAELRETIRDYKRAEVEEGEGGLVGR